MDHNNVEKPTHCESKSSTDQRVGTWPETFASKINGSEKRTYRWLSVKRQNSHVLNGVVRLLLNGTGNSISDHQNSIFLFMAVLVADPFLQQQIMNFHLANQRLGQELQFLRVRIVLISVCFVSIFSDHFFFFLFFLIACVIIIHKNVLLLVQDERNQKERMPSPGTAWL